MKRRGQAVMELSIGLLVLTGTLMLTLHLAELGSLSLQTEQVAHTALWDASAYRAQRFGAWSDSGRIASRAADASAGRRAAVLAGATAVVTRTSWAEGRCVRANLGFDVSRHVQPFAEAGGTRCQASATAATPGLPLSFAEGDRGFFSAALSVRQERRVCGAGRDGSAGCRRGFAILQGDHGLTDLTEAAECALQPGTCVNTPFRSVTETTWNRSMGWTGEPERFVRRIAGRLPAGRITGFYFSFRGEESYFTEVVGGEGWETSPMDSRRGYREAFNARRACSRSGRSYCYLGVFATD